MNPFQRKFSRHEYVIEVHIKSINNDKDEDKLKHNRVIVNDISRGGIGFDSGMRLTVGYFYEFNITLWDSTVFSVVVKIVREVKTDTGYRYGGEFIGLSDFAEALLETYGIFADKRKE